MTGNLRTGPNRLINTVKQYMPACLTRAPRTAAAPRAQEKMMIGKGPESTSELLRALQAKPGGGISFVPDIDGTIGQPLNPRPFDMDQKVSLLLKQGLAGFRVLQGDKKQNMIYFGDEGEPVTGGNDYSVLPSARLPVINISLSKPEGEIPGVTLKERLELIAMPKASLWSRIIGNLWGILRR